MKFDRLISKYITEAQDLPPRMRLDVEDQEDEPLLSKSGALAQFLASLDPDVVGAARGKATELETGEVQSESLDVLRAKIGNAYQRFMNDDYTPRSDVERSVIDKFTQLGIGPEGSEILYLMGSQIARNLFKLKNLETTNPKRITLLDTNDEDEDSDNTRTISPVEVARNTLEKFYKVFQDNEENGTWNELGSNSLVLQDGKINYIRSAPSGDRKIEWKKLIFKQVIDLLRYLTNLPQLMKATKKFGWNFQMTQDTGKGNYLALDIASTPTNWIIYTKKGSARKDPSLRAVHGPMSTVIFNRLTSDQPSEEKNIPNRLPIKFVNGVPQYGTQIEPRELIRITNREFLELLGYETVYDALYAKLVAKDKTFTLPNGTVIDLTQLNVGTRLGSGWELTKDPSLKKKKEKVARTGFRPEARPVELTDAEREKIRRDAAKLSNQ